jgi:hypothetical protein
VIACYACNQARGRIECKLTRPTEHSDYKQLHEQPYQERKCRLKRLKDRAEQGIEGLISVMGLPLTNYLDDFILQQKQR